MDMKLEMSQLEGAATRLEQLNSSMNGLRTTLTDICGDSNSFWMGACKDAYRIRCGDIVGELNNYTEKLGRLSSALRSAVSEYREMEGLQKQTVASLSDITIF